MAKQKTSNARRANVEQCGVLMYVEAVRRLRLFTYRRSSCRFFATPSKFDDVGIRHTIMQGTFLVVKDHHQVTDAENNTGKKLRRHFTKSRSSVTDGRTILTNNLDAQDHLAGGLPAVTGEKDVIGKADQVTKKMDNKGGFTGATLTANNGHGTGQGQQATKNHLQAKNNSGINQGSNSTHPEGCLGHRVHGIGVDTGHWRRG